MRWIYYIGFFLSCWFAGAQTHTLSLYYDINGSSLEGQASRLDSLYLSFAAGTPTLSIFGYADFLHNTVYNLQLSRKRANAVKAYLEKKKGKSIVIRTCEGLGEGLSADNGSRSGEPLQRRVDIIIEQKQETKRISKHPNTTQEEPVAEDTVASSERRELSELKEGESLVIKGLNFIPGRHAVTRSSAKALERLLEVMKRHPDLKIEIQGHICCVIDLEDGYDYDARNYKLSENRAKSVYNYLVKNGIQSSRMSYKGYGRTQPKVPVELTPEDEQANRRVEIKVIGN